MCRMHLRMPDLQMSCRLAFVSSRIVNPAMPEGDIIPSLQWRHSGIASQITRLAIVYSIFLFRRRSKKTPKLRVTGLCAGNSPGIGEFPAQMASNAENFSIRWRHHVYCYFYSPANFLITQHTVTNIKATGHWILFLASNQMCLSQIINMYVWGMIISLIRIRYFKPVLSNQCSNSHITVSHYISILLL